MKKRILLGLFLHIFFSVGDIYSQGLQNDLKVRLPDFSGIWKLNFDKSRIPYDGSRRDPNFVRMMIIEQNLPAIHLTIKIQKGTSADENYIGEKFVLYTDGRGDEYIKEFERWISITKWQADKLIVFHYANLKATQNNLEEIQEFALSGDGRTITEVVKQSDIRPILNKDGTVRAEKYFDDSFTSYLIWERIK